AHRQRELAVVADRDAGAQAGRGLEHVQRVAALDHAQLPLEAGELQLVLEHAAPVGRVPPGAVPVAAVAGGGEEGPGLDREAEAAREPRIERMPRLLQRL